MPENAFYEHIVQYFFKMLIIFLGKDRVEIHPKVIKIKEYKGEAVKLVIEWIKG